MTIFDDFVAFVGRDNLHSDTKLNTHEFQRLFEQPIERAISLELPLTMQLLDAGADPSTIRAYDYPLNCTNRGYQNTKYVLKHPIAVHKCSQLIPSSQASNNPGYCAK